MIIGIDVGGTTIKFGLFDNDNLIEKFELETTTDIVSVIKEGVTKLSSFGEIEGVGVTVPAPVKHNYVFKAPNINMENVNVKDMLTEALGIENIAVINDANAAALGEYYYGGSYDSAVMITLGTGVGGGIIIDGNVLEGFSGFGGEIGHIQLDHKYNFECGCGATGCSETVASATGLTRLYKLYERDELEARDIFDLAKADDEMAVKIVKIYTDYIGKLCQHLSVIINPEIFIIGGGVSKAGNYLLELVKKSFINQTSFESLKTQEFKLAELGNDAGMFGAYYSVKKAS